MIRCLLSIGLLLGFAACQSPQLEIQESFFDSSPRSILVLPPLDESIETGATYGTLASASYALAENGYYVFPVAVVDGLMKANGLPTPYDMHQVPLDRLREIFGADAVLYLKVTDWGTSFMLFDSQTRITIEGQLVDTATSAVLWTGVESQVRSSSAGSSDPLGMLVSAVVNQVATTVNDPSRAIAAIANGRLLRGQGRGWLPGPYHPDLDAEMSSIDELRSQQLMADAP